MNPTGPNPYLRTRIMTASPQELRLMLYEGAIKFCQQAMVAMEAREWENSYNALLRAQKIVLELSTSLNHEVAPDLCNKLSALYTFIYRRLVDANVEHQSAPIQEALRLLEYEKETWQLLINKITSESGRQPGDSIANITGAQQTAISSLSTNA